MSLPATQLQWSEMRIFTSGYWPQEILIQVMVSSLAFITFLDALLVDRHHTNITPKGLQVDRSY